MACGGCRKNGGGRHTNKTGNLSKFGYLTPRQLKLLEQQKANEEEEEDSGETE